MTFLNLSEEFRSKQDSRFVVLPVPYEQTTSYGKGTSLGPQAIIEASAYVEFYDDVFRTEAYREGIYTANPVEFCGEVEKDFAGITSAVNKYLDLDKFVISIGGEHSISLPVYKAYHGRYEKLSILHFDAHSDLRESYEDSIYSHASVMRRIYELNASILQIGVRSQCIEEAQFIETNHIPSFNAHVIRQNGFTPDLLDSLKENVFITFDVDFFDPSIMPATGTPEPGGFQWDETMEFLEIVFRFYNVVGCDVVELSPIKDLPFADFLAAKLVYKLFTLKMLGKN